MSKRNQHGCLYYICIWPIVAIFKLMFYLLLFAAALIISVIKTLFDFAIKGNRKSYSSMSGLEFEEYAASVLRNKGFKGVKVTQGSGDQGIDILASKKGVSYAIQVKKYSRPVGNKAVQEAYSGCAYYECDVPVVLTNSTFTPSAKELAKKNNVELWNIDKI